MKLFNTQTQQIEPFRPFGNQVLLYVCGITPYDTTHLGHAFTYCAADVLVRYLEMKGWPVKYCQNVTDLDDDMLQQAQSVAEDWHALGNRWTQQFIVDMQALNVRPPDYLPRATDVIPQIIDAVGALITAGVAYEAAGNVYFHTAAWSEYGRLSQIPRADMLPTANEHGNHPDDPHKKDPLDFILWQAQKKDDEPAWASPWRNGRPGWHIECSTIATQYLGETIDIHLGGADLLFPHHECELAQVESAGQQKPFARFWLHTAMVKQDGQKMGKSLGNLVLISDLLQRHSPDALRIYLAQHHYRQPWTHDKVALGKAAKGVEKIKAALTAVSTGSQPLNITPIQNRFIATMDNDLDTVKGIATLLNLADEILFRAPNGYQIDEAQFALQRMASVFGLQLNEEKADEQVVTGWNNHRQRFT